MSRNNQLNTTKKQDKKVRKMHSLNQIIESQETNKIVSRNIIDASRSLSQ